MIIIRDHYHVGLVAEITRNHYAIGWRIEITRYHYDTGIMQISLEITSTLEEWQ